MSSCNTYGLFILFISVNLSDSFFQNSESLFKNIGGRKIVYPKVLTRREAISRLKRWSNGDKHVERESLYIALDRWTIKTNSNDGLLISPNYVSQWTHSAKKTRPLFDYDKEKLHKCLPLKGSVEGINNSSVLLTLCNNDIFGLINTNRKSFFLQPTDVNRRHILYETTIPYKLTMTMKKNSSNSRGWMGNQFNKDPIMNRMFNNYRRSSSREEDRCMTLVVGSNETRYIEVESSLCAKSNRKNNNEENVEIITNRERSRRELEQFNHAYNGYNTERPYRTTLDCFERKRNKRALAICDTAEYYNMTNDLAAADYIQYVDTQYGTRLGYSYDDEADVINDDYHILQNTEDEKKYAYVSSKQMPMFTPPTRTKYRWAKMVVGVDYDVIKFHGRRTEHYVFTVFNIVSSLFKEISSVDILRIVIMKMFFYPDDQDSVIRSGDMHYPLYSVNRWNRDVWQNAEEKYDMAIWYTHFQINEETSTSPGPYMCQWQWSCLLIEDVGWLSAVRIAHGIGHLIGLTHDGDLSANNNCGLDALSETTIMAAVIPAVMPNPTWSSCSKSEYEFAVRKYPCLETPPLSYEHTVFLNEVFSLDEQCRIEFGDGWVFCSRVSVRDPCKELWCNRSIGKRRSCMTRQTPTLEGTSCSRGKRCINQTCEYATSLGYIQDVTSQPPILSYPESTTTSQSSGYIDYVSSSPGYPQYTTFTPSGPRNPETTTYRPDYSNYPETTTYRSFQPPRPPETITINPQPPPYPETTTYRPSGHLSYLEPTIQDPLGYPKTATYSAQLPNYPEITTYGPGYPTYPETSFSPFDFPNFPEMTSYRPPGDPSYPKTSFSPLDFPNYPEMSPYRPPGHPSYPETSFNPLDFPNYSEMSPYRPPGHPSYPETSFSPLDFPNYPEMSPYRPSVHPSYPETSFNPLDFSNYPETSYRPPDSSSYPETTLYSPPGDSSYSEMTSYSPFGDPSYPETSHSPPDF